ncbi:MAG: DUF4332 domain-containing protein [Alphaproteobacteria bacterium]
MTYPIEKIEGIGPAYGQKLLAAGIKTTDDLLAKAATPKDRATLAQATGLPEKSVLKWANMADLMRIKGVGEEYSELLEAAGVDTVKELKMRVPANLAQAMAKANEAKKLVRVVPSEKQVTDWVGQAKTLPAKLSY